CASRGEAIKASAAATMPNRTMMSPFDTKTRSLIHLRKELRAPVPAPRFSKEDASVPSRNPQASPIHLPANDLLPRLSHVPRPPEPLSSYRAVRFLLESIQKCTNESRT